MVESDVAARVRELHTAIGQARQRHARGEAILAQATQQRDEILRTLQERYGVSSLEEANQMLAALRGQVEEKLSAGFAALGNIS